MQMAEALFGALGTRRDLERLRTEGACVQIRISGGDHEDYPRQSLRTMPAGVGLQLSAADMRAIIEPFQKGDRQRCAEIFMKKFSHRYGFEPWIEDVIWLKIWRDGESHE